MRISAGRVLETRWNAGQGRSAVIECPPVAVPSPGRYLLAWSPDDPAAPLAQPLFLSEIVDGGFVAASPVPPSWEPGTHLQLRGPLGHGFDLPSAVRRLALAALGPTDRRLLPLLHNALAAPQQRSSASVALFTDLRLETAGLPSAVEINPLAALPDSLLWADFLALDVPLERIGDLPARLGLSPETRRLPCPAQVLVVTPMPCGGVGGCGACSLETPHGWKTACDDGPVFPLEALL